MLPGREAEEVWGRSVQLRWCTVLRKTIYATLIVILTMGSAFAQADLKDIQGGENSVRDQQEKKNDRAIDRDYQSTMQRIPDKGKKESDPWGDVRPTPPAATKNK
jgi:hypothetical protein